jgi:glycogen operon protein
MAPRGLRLRPGSPVPLGATWDGTGVNFAIWSEHATAIELCLFDVEEPGREKERIRLRERTDQVWHARVAGLAPGALYGYRAHGPYMPHEGHRFNPAKLLLDPYARAISGSVAWHDALLGGRGPADVEPDGRDSAPYTARSVVVDSAFDWGDDRPPATPWHRTVLYEAHVKGLTARHPDLPPALRGTYAGLGAPPVTDYLRDLGVTAVELLPVHHAVPERALVARGLTNYWGYNSIGYFAPDSRFASAGSQGEQVTEFKAMVRALHRAGIEVILDVVYNHTAEGGRRGPTLSFRGLGDGAYYWLDPADGAAYVDWTGCGNSWHTPHPRALQLVMDSLRYWVQEMRVDGFRFDLAPVLARTGLGDVNLYAPFLGTIRQDPVLAGVKLIAEAWDVGPDGYLVGRFPAGWAEWNGRYRDTVRSFWRGDAGQAADLGFRLTGSSDLYAASGRHPAASVNFVAVHDGFTLADLVSYEHKHNAANGEENKDGTDDNHAWNCGVEGPTTDPAVLALRERQMRNFLATLLLSQGVPMLAHGDEVARTQSGNNNVYCQDGPLSWIAWEPSPAADAQRAFTRRLIALRRAEPVFQRRTFSTARGLTWMRPDGKEMTSADWSEPATRALGLLLRGDRIDEVDEAGEPIVGATFLVLLNAGAGAVPFIVPAPPGAARWATVLDTRQWEPPTAAALAAGDTFTLAERSLAVLRLDVEGDWP